MVLKCVVLAFGGKRLIEADRRQAFIGCRPNKPFVSALSGDPEVSLTRAQVMPSHHAAGRRSGSFIGMPSRPSSLG